MTHIKPFDVIKQQTLAARSVKSSGEHALPVGYHIQCALFIFVVVCRLCVQCLGVTTRLIARVGIDMSSASCHRREHMAQATVDGGGARRPREEKNN